VDVVTNDESGGFSGYALLAGVLVAFVGMGFVALRLRRDQS
jgi:hypothetical protein